MFEFFRTVLSRYRVTVVGCVALMLLTALLASEAVPELYPVEAQVLMVEPVAVHRLANPFAPVPSSKRELADIPELLRSRERLVAIVKRTGLVDQWDLGRPWPLLLKDRLQTAVLGPMDEKDRLDALVQMVDKRLFVGVEGNKVRIAAMWTTPALSQALVENTLGTLLQLRTQREGKTLQDAAEALDRQYEGVRTEMNERAARMESVLARPGGWAQVEGDREQLVRDQSRAAELLVASEEKHITSEVFRQSNTLRFMVVRPPVQPREAAGPAKALRVFSLVLGAVLVALLCAAILGVGSGRLLSKSQVTSALGLEVLSSVRVGKGSAFLLRSKRGLGLAFFISFLTGLVIAITRGNPLFAMLPPLAFAAAWLVWTRPLKWPFLLLLFLTSTLDDPTDRAYVGLWQSPLWPLGKFFYLNIAAFTGFELAVLGLTFVMVVRRVWLPQRELAKLDPVHGQAPRPLQLALIVSGLTVVVLTVMGVARGGLFREALWQFRDLLMMPLVATLALYALDLPKDLPKLVAVLMGGSLVKALLGIYFMYAIAFPAANYPPHTTGHNDTLIFVVAVVAALALFWEKPIRRHFWMFVCWMPFVFVALKLNDRRIAYVDIVLALGLIFLLSPMHEMKRKAVRFALMLAPVLLLYTVAGWNQPNGRLFGPVQKVRSIIAPAENTEEESSNVERDIENYNLMKSWENNMIIGQGFGHAFTEYVPSNDFKQSAFGHIGHNSILWLLWIGGIVGFTCVLGYLAVAIFFLGRTLQVTTQWRERVALLVALGIICTYLMQAFGDMGTQAIMSDFYVGTALAIIGRLATKANVWRVPAPLPTAVQVPEAIRV